MPATARVILKYGPYESCGLVEHRDCRLRGLITMLKKNNHTVELEKIEDWNMVEAWVNGEQIFKCNIKDLDYGEDGDLDELVTVAVNSVIKAF